MSKKSLREQAIDIFKVLGIGIISFALIGYFVFMDSTKFNQQAQSIGSVNGQEMAYSQDSKFARYYQNYSERYGVSDPEQVRQIVFREVAKDMLYQQKAKEYGIKVSDQALVGLIKRNEFVTTNAQGQYVFDEELYGRYLKYERSSTKLKIEKSYRENMRKNLLMSDLVSPVRVTKLELEEEYKVQNTARKVELLYINQYDELLGMDIDEDKLKEFYEESKSNFKSYSIAYIEFSDKDSALDAYLDYAASKEDYDAVLSGAVELPAGAISSAPYAPYTKYDYPIATSKLDKLEEGMLLEPIYSPAQDSYHLAWVAEINEPQYEKDSVRRGYLTANADELAEGVIPNIKSKLNQLAAVPQGFAAASTRDDKVQYILTDYFIFDKSVPVLAAGGGDELPQEISQSPAFYKTAFSLNPGDVSTSVELEAGVAVIRVLDAIKAQGSPESGWTSSNYARVKESLYNGKAASVRTAWEEKVFQSAEVVYKLNKEQ